ncbi:hypothetical protein NKH18_42915 [Streptomyces sp. M10(2022)]
MMDTPVREVALWQSPEPAVSADTEVAVEVLESAGLTVRWVRTVPGSTLRES